MRPIDFLTALGVGVGVLALTLALSYPMVAFYATFIETGHPQQFYVDAAQWIAPWSSHVFGPILFFAFNWWLARRSPQRNALAFAVSSILLYVVVDWGMVVAAGYSLGVMLTARIALSLGAKLLGALAGAYLGARNGPQRQPASPLAS